MERYLLKFSIELVPFLLAITCHEVSHGFVADRLGDRTARCVGRLTLNPLKHLDLIGTLMLLFAPIGWAKPVPVNFGNLRKPKRDMIWVAIAGPVTNVVLATLCAVGLRGGVALLNSVPAGTTTAAVLQPVLLMLAFSVYLNLGLAVFNLIPIPPLDGGRVAVGLLPLRAALAWSKLERYGMLILVLLVFSGAFAYILFPPVEAGVRILTGPETQFVFRALFTIL